MRAADILGIACITLLALWLRWPSPDPGLNYDELQSVTFAAMPPAEMLHTLPQVDPHPPLYYLQLHFWPGLLHGDIACRWNSVLWGMLALALFSAAAKRMFGAPTAWITVLLLAVAPLEVYYAGSVRMYAMITALTGLAFLGVAFMETAGNPRHLLLGSAMVIAGAVGAGWSQGAGFLFGSALVFYFALRVLSIRRAHRVAISGLVIVLLTASALLPWLLRARDISVGHLARPDTWRVAVTLKEFLLGIGSWPQGAVYASAALLLLVCAVAILISSPSRRMVLAFVIAPLLAMGVVSMALRPIWDTRTVAWVAPFLFVAVAVVLARAIQGPRWRRTLGLLLGLALVVGMLPGIHKPFTVDFGYRELGAYLRATAQASDVIFAPKRDLWGLAWYTGGTGTVHPLKTTEVQGAIKITNQADFEPPPGACVWLVYRDKHQGDIAATTKRLANEGLNSADEMRFGLLHAVEYHARIK